MSWMHPWFTYTQAAVMFNAPADSGVYVLGVPHGECLLVGEAKDVQTALLELLESEIPWKDLAREITFSTEQIDGGSRDLRRRELIAEMKPRLNCVESRA